jgi:hypothetical protein
LICRSIDLWDAEILQWLQILTPGRRSGRPVFHLSSCIFLNSMFQCFTFHLSKFNVSIFHLQSAIRLFQRTGQLGHASLSCIHESVIPLGHKQHSTQTLKYVDKNFCVWSNFLCKVDICRLIRLIERGSPEHRFRPRQVPSSSASLLYCHRDQREVRCADRCPRREAYDRAALHPLERSMRDLWHLHLLAELDHILLAPRKTHFSCGCSRN